MGQRFWRFVWDLSEFSGIRLGRFAPAVFQRAFRLGTPVEVTEAEFMAAIDAGKVEAERLARGGERS